MAISAIGGGAASSYLASAIKPEATEVHRGGRDARHDGDADDHSVSAAAPASQSVNGIGSIINTQA